jgi:CDP-6-deoxy-D-xylo-4-hexulose-3-dehydrase
MLKSKFKWQLINDSITDTDKRELIDFISTPNQRFTQGNRVKQFEKEWSEWLGVKYSVFVNSGASANYIMASIMKETKGLGEVIVSPIGWVSDVAPLVNLGFTPVFVDVSMNTMSITLDNIKAAVTDKTVGVVFVDALGFGAMSDEIVQYCKANDLFLIEDCCESHGATYGDKKCGTDANVSNFSFYFGHHITTIEGGMVCTNDDDIYDYAKLFRSHGMTRGVSKKIEHQYRSQYPELNPLFTFAVPGYNLRNTELYAVLGSSQLKRLDHNIQKRTKNLNLWLGGLDSEKYFTDYQTKGSSNFALPLILKENDKNLFQSVCDLLDSSDVEYRIGTAGGGNQSKQPYLEKYKFKQHMLITTEHIHQMGLYVGNHPELYDEQITELCENLNKLCWT